MTLGVQPAWAIHLQPGSQIPLQDEAARRYLRRGYLAEALLRAGARPALVAGDVALSYDELRAAASATAGRLKEIGVTQGLHVALLAENSAAWIISYLGLQVLGATVVGMNPAFKEAEAEQILTDSEAAVALVDAGRQSLVDALRLFHVHGLAIALHGSLIAGGCAVLVPFSPENVVRELRAGGTMFFGVPAMYQRLADFLDRNPADLRHVRLFVAGSAPLPTTLFERCGRVLGQPVLGRYGITEGGIVVSDPYDGPRQPGRVGYPLPGVEVRLGEQDEVQLKGGQVFKGYWRNAAASADAFADGWFRTGDIGEIAGDGSLAIRGRIKELIISGGYNVYPREVEIVLEQHPAVAEVAVAGLPSERWGEEVTAFGVRRAPVKSEELISFARERLATYKCPRAVRFIAAIPRNAMGKIDRSKLE